MNINESDILISKNLRPFREECFYVLSKKASTEGDNLAYGPIGTTTYEILSLIDRHRMWVMEKELALLIKDGKLEVYTKRCDNLE